jgi:DMSO/TMAO reductase YedYZ molybdopterin-dependent catalytic subunit
LSRRLVFRQTLSGLLAMGGGSTWLGSIAASRGDEPSSTGLIVRNMRPLDLETPIGALDSWLTPNRVFFVRSHIGVPAVELGPWRLRLTGMVDRPATLGLEDLKGLERVTVPGVLQCAGNGRALFRPTIPGVPWEKGAVGHAEWTGVRLVDLLQRAGVQQGAAHVHLIGADAPPSPKTPAYIRSIPIARALSPDTLLATEMNGEPLPVLHGGPIRLIVPGWTGNHWIKWVRTINVAREEAPGPYQQASYKMAKVPAPPGAVLKPTDLVPVETMNVKSLITAPESGSRLSPGRYEIRGVAWTGSGFVTRVEVSIDREEWQPATLHGPERPGSWRQWRFAWNAPARGRHLLRARATDSNGEVQPETTPWNRSGYLWNGIDQVSCEIG